MFPILLGVILGVVQKLFDDPDIIGELHILDYIFGRFSIWIFIAVLLVISAKSQRYAITRVFLFFVCMLATYYAYTIIFLNFTPKNQIILWGTICLITPICAIIVWNVCKHKWSSNIFGGLLIAILFTEWYITTKGYDERILMLGIYIIMAGYMIKMISKNILQAVCIILIASMLSFILLYTGWIQNIFDTFLNVLY